MPSANTMFSYTITQTLAGDADGLVQGCHQHPRPPNGIGPMAPMAMPSERDSTGASLMPSAGRRRCSPPPAPPYPQAEARCVPRPLSPVSMTVFPTPACFQGGNGLPLAWGFTTSEMTIMAGVLTADGQMDDGADAMAVVPRNAQPVHELTVAHGHVGAVHLGGDAIAADLLYVRDTVAVDLAAVGPLEALADGMGGGALPPERRTPEPSSGAWCLW